MHRCLFNRSSLVVFVAGAMLGGCSAHGALVPSSQWPASAQAGNAAASPLVVLHVFRTAKRGMNPYAPVVADSAGSASSSFLSILGSRVPNRLSDRSV